MRGVNSMRLDAGLRIGLAGARFERPRVAARALARPAGRFAMTLSVGSEEIKKARHGAKAQLTSLRQH